MSEQSRAFDEWLDATLAGRKPDAGEFARSAIGEVPPVQEQPRRLDPRKWGFKTEAEMNAAWGIQ